jgi:hypothetical protein
MSSERDSVSDVAAVERAVDRELPDMARSVIRSHLDLTEEANRSFLERPDDRTQHQTEWHQWGIITHTRRFLHDYDTLVPRYLAEWGLEEEVERVLSLPIDGAPRRDLLRVTILLHDIGKFAARTRGRDRFHFARHEELSGSVIRSELHLERFGLTPRQLEYVARTAEDHFVLGLIRKRAREEGGYDLGFVESPRFAELADRIKREHPDDFVEIGVLFLGDSLAKAEPPGGPRRALSQYDINIAVAHRYLGLVLDRPSL